MYFTSTTFLALAYTASAAPSWNMKRAAAITDADILQYALTLEHLENAFYKQALSSWPDTEFIAAGFSADFYDQLKYVAHDEEGHVLYLEAGLTAAGATPNAACEYDFPMTDPLSFVQLASVIEGVGVSAYLGAAADITSKAYLTAAGSILVTEALHQSAQRNAIGEIPMANVFGTPMGINAVYTIASQFITSCPSTNAPLPVMAYPSLKMLSGSPTAEGVTIDLQPASASSGTCYATFVSGLQIVAVAATVSGDTLSAEVPMQLEGQSYVFITSDNSGNLTDDTILAGPAILEITPSSPTFNVTILKV